MTLLKYIPLIFTFILIITFFFTISLLYFINFSLKNYYKFNKLLNHIYKLHHRLLSHINKNNKKYFRNKVHNYYHCKIHSQEKYLFSHIILLLYLYILLYSCTNQGALLKVDDQKKQDMLCKHLVQQIIHIPSMNNDNRQ